MSEVKGLLNYQIAEIYDRMMNGDKGALSKLQQINSHPIPTKESIIPIKQKTIIFNDNNGKEQIVQLDLSQSKLDIKDSKQAKPIPSLPYMQLSKDHIFLNVLKKGAQLDSSKILEKPRAQSKRFKRIVNSTHKQYGLQSNQQPIKEINLDKQIKQSYNQIDFKISIDNSALNKDLKAYALPRVNKAKETQMVKAQSTHIQSKKVTQMENIQKSKLIIKKQKINFQEIIGKNKRMKEQFEKTNNEEKQLQLQIISYHNETKQFLDQMQKKYEINLSNTSKYLKRKNKEISEAQKFAEMTQSKSQKKMSPFKTAMLSQTQKCMEIQNELSHLKSLCRKNESVMKKLQRQRQGLLFNRYLDRYGLQIQEQAQEENDTVEPLIESEPHQQKYKYSMARTRQKKWSLIQRTEYEAQRTHSLQQSRKANTTSRTTEQTQIRAIINNEDQNRNKVIVNERLKNLLFS